MSTERLQLAVDAVERIGRRFDAFIERRDSGGVVQTKDILRRAKAAGGGWKNDWKRAKHLIEEHGVSREKGKRGGLKNAFMLEPRYAFGHDSAEEIRDDRRESRTRR